MYTRFIKQHGSDIHIAGILLERYRFGLTGLMVLKGMIFGLFLPFFHQMVLKGGAIVTYGLKMSSISFVDSTIGAWTMYDHPHSNISVTVPVIHLMGPVPCLLGKNWTCSLTLRTHRSLALWALLRFSFCFS